jgi:hypothetical protein
MRLGQSVLLSYTILIICLLFVFISCEDEQSICPHCNDNNGDKEKSAMIAVLSGAFNLTFKSQSFEYHTFDLNEYKMREIVSKIYIDSAFLEIRITFNDNLMGKQSFDFSGNDAAASITVYTIPAEYFQHNLSGMINVSNVNDDEISATFSLAVSTADEQRKINVSQGVINFVRKK